MARNISQFVGGVFIDLFDEALLEADIDGTPTSTQFNLVGELDPLLTATITGTGFGFDGNGDPTGGTINTIEAFYDGAPTFTASNLAISLVDLVAAIDDILDFNDYTAYDAILEAVAINYTAATATGGVEFEGTDLNDTIVGSDGTDILDGRGGNDTINPGDNSDYDEVTGSTGDDTIIYSDNAVGYQYLGYYRLNAAITATINGFTNTATVNKGANGTDTIVDIENPLDAGFGTIGGFEIEGTIFNDTFNINTDSATQWMAVQGNAGDDTINITNGLVRLDYRGEDNGISADLDAGTVTDGNGDTDTITGSVFEIRGTDNADTLLGSSGDDRFIGRAGADTIDGRGGTDLLRFDRSSIDAPVIVNLGLGTATGSFGGEAFSYTISNIEEIRGSSFGDTIVGSDGTDILDGRGGNDTINPGDNSDYDEVTGSTGDDTIIYSDNAVGYQYLGYYRLNAAITATINGFTNTATVNKGANGTDTIVDIENPLDAGFGTIGGFEIEGTIFNDTFNINTDSATQWMAVQGNAGDDTINITNGLVRLDYRGEDNGISADLDAGTVTDGNGDTDTITGSVFEIRGTDNADTLLGSSGDDRFIGRAGADTIDGRGGTDLLRFDRSSIDAPVIVNLGLGTATGSFGGEAFSYTISNIEEIRGSSFGDTIVGSDGTDILDGRGGNDTINPGDNSDYDEVTGSTGDDTIIYSDNAVGYQYLGYYRLNAAITATINGFTNTATVNKGANGTDTIVDIENPLDAGFGTIGGFEIEGTIFNDTFNINTDSATQWMAVQGNAGDDTINITNGLVRLDYRGEDNGISADLDAGTVTDGNGDTDTITGSVFEIRGTDNADTLLGSSGDDRFIGRAGADTIDGRGGTDLLRFDRSSIDAPVIVNLGLGTATGSFGGEAFSYTISNIEEIRGSSFGDTITGNASNNELEGRDGDDTLNGGAGVDTLNGGAGNDTLDGGSAADVMEGGAGNDTYYVNAVADQVVELSNEGLDEIRSTISFTLSDNVENGMLLTTGGTLTGNALNNRLEGNALGNTLSGGAGVDTLLGGAGNDSLDGGAASDVMEGGTGNDTYYVNAVADQVIELAGQGVDEIRSTISVTLSANVENGMLLTSGTALTGNELNNQLVGNALNNILTGGAGADFLSGGEGADFLDGGTASDQMEGGQGNDIYIFDAAGDQVVEAFGEGTDEVRSKISYTLSDNVENAQLIGSGIALIGNDLANTLTGSNANNRFEGGGGADTIIGNAGGDILDGGLGADTLEGGLGNDTYFLDDAGDVIIEGVGEGFDVLRSTVSVVMADNVENGKLLGTATDLTGNDLDNRLIGNGENNVIMGGGGADDIFSGGGADDIDGGAGADFIFAGGGADIIRGGADDDEINGHTGDDRIFGDGGADRLTGSYNVDTFVFELVSDSGTTAITRDVITDFGFGGADQIDVSAIDANADVSGDQAFLVAQGGAIGTISQTVQGSDLLLEFHVDSALGADFSILLEGVALVEEADFFL